MVHPNPDKDGNKVKIYHPSKALPFSCLRNPAQVTTTISEGKAQTRLCGRYRLFETKGKLKVLPALQLHESLTAATSSESERMKYHVRTVCR